MKPRKKDVEDHVSVLGAPIDVRAVPRMRGENPWHRFLRNLLFGLGSRSGVEASLWCEDERQRPIEFSDHSDNDEDP